MPLPSPSGKEDRKSFVSRCVSDLTKKGEGKDAAQRVAICNSQFRKAKAGEILNENEAKAVEEVTKLKRKPKKKKKDKYRITVEDGSGTDPTAA